MVKRIDIEQLRARFKVYSKNQADNIVRLDYAEWLEWEVLDTDETLHKIHAEYREMADELEKARAEVRRYPQEATE